LVRVVFRHAVGFGLLAGLIVSAAWPAAAQTSSARTMFRAAEAREREARAALARPDAPAGPTLRLVRSAIAAHRNVVRRYPRSGYCDDALWRAADLSGAAFERFAEERDRTARRTALQLLINEYPSSRFVPLAQGALERLAAGSATPRAAAPAVGQATAATGREAQPVPAFVAPPAVPPAPTPAPLPAPTPATAATPDDAPIWSLPIGQTFVIGLPPATARSPAEPAQAASAWRALLPMNSAYGNFVPRSLLTQQPAVQVVVGSQFTTGDDVRTGGQPRVDPDLGIQVFQPGLAIGNFYADVNVTHRDNRAAVGRGVVRLDGFRLGGLVWSVDGGDTWNAPVVQDFGFTNLFAPPVTFQGLSASGASTRTFVMVSGGRVTSQRNIFGTDTESTGQRVYQGLFSHRASDALDVFAHANHTNSEAMTTYTPLTEWSTDAGGGVRYRPRPAVELVADASLSHFRRRGASTAEQTAAGLVGALWSLPRGWVQVNAQRYPVGRFPIYNYPYIDRAGVFGSGEFDLGSRARVFGGAEYARSNLDPEAAATATAGVAPGNGTRAYGGVRLSLFDTSMVTLRVDGGGRRTEPSRFGPGFESNTGVAAIDWHSRFPRGNVFARYERRSAVDPASEASSFTQHDLMAQAYLGFSGNRQIFATMLASRRADRSGDGQTLWQAGAGAQSPLGPLYVRVEGIFGQTLSWTTGFEANRQSVSAGMSGQVARNSYLSVDCYLDYMPVAAGPGNPWVTRTMVRFTRLFPFGPSRMPPAAGQPLRGGATGRITGTVFVDWNANGEQEVGEDAIGGVTVAIPGVASVVSGADGRFTASGVPVGEQRAVLDLASVPADYDPPADAERTVRVERGQVAAVGFGMLPLGTFGGMVYQDADGDGQLGKADTPIDGAVLVMDDGSRTEVTRGGHFTFDPVRMGKHTVSLLVASLPDGAQVAGPTVADVELARGQNAPDVVFLVKVEKRPEVRKVFPPKKK
jgi:hypothetical protein